MLFFVFVLVFYCFIDQLFYCIRVLIKNTINKIANFVVMDLSIGTSFGAISGILTSVGLILSGYGAKLPLQNVILTLISLAISDSLSDALGIYYGSYVDDRDIKKSLVEALRTFVGKSSIPILFTLIFYVANNMLVASVINILLAFVGIMIINFTVFKDTKQKVINMMLFVLIIVCNYILGKQF